MANHGGVSRSQSVLAAQPRKIKARPWTVAGVSAKKKNKKVEELKEQKPLVGSVLRQTRQAKGFSLEAISQATAISVSMLHALEQAVYEQLPADTYVRGFIILYAEVLDVDGVALAERFFLERDAGKQPGGDKKNTLRHPLTPQKMAEAVHVSSASQAVGLLLFIVVSFTSFSIYSSWHPIPSFGGKNKPLASSSQQLFHPADPATRSEATSKALNLEAHFLKDTEVLLLLDSQKTAIRERYPKNATARWKAEQRLRVEFSAPGSAELRLNGNSIAFPKSFEGRSILKLKAESPAA